MARGLGSSFKAALASGYIKPCFLLDIELSNGTYLRYTTWDRDISYSANTYSANGYFKSPGQIQQGLDGADGMTIDLVGEPSVMIATLLTSLGRRRLGILRLALLDSSNSVIDTPIRFDGYLETVSLHDTPEEAMVTLNYKSELSRIHSPVPDRMNHESQQIYYPGDKGFEYLDRLKDLRVIWGRAKVRVDRYGNAVVKPPKKQQGRTGKSNRRRG